MVFYEKPSKQLCFDTFCRRNQQVTAGDGICLGFLNNSEISVAFRSKSIKNHWLQRWLRQCENPWCETGDRRWLSPGHSQQPVSPQDFFLMAWLANVTTRFFFARAMPNATTGFFDCGRHMFFGTFPAKGKHSNQLVFWGILVLDQSGCVTTGFFSPGPAGPCHHRIFFDGTGSAMSPQDFYLP